MDKKTIKYLMDIANVHQSDIARELKVSPAVVSMPLSGVRNNIKVQKKVASTLGRNIEDIFPDGENKRRRKVA